jgi:hypothetical protein
MILHYLQTVVFAAIAVQYIISESALESVLDSFFESLHEKVLERASHQKE